jgi:hypothetical protein
MLGGVVPLRCGVPGFERLTYHHEVGHSLIEESGEIRDDAPVSQVRIRIIVRNQGFGNVSCQDIPFTLNVFSLIMVNSR